MLQDWDKRFPGRNKTLFNALSRITPSHLMDPALFDFRNLVASGVPDPEGDRAFDPESFAAPGIIPLRPGAVQVRSLVARVTIRDGVASTELERVLYNDGGTDAEADWILPLPEGATADGFTMTVGDKVGIDVRGQFPDEAAAEQVQKTLPGLLTKARLMLPLMAALRGGDEGKLLGQLAGLVTKLETKQEGSEVSGRLDVETADAVGGLMRLPTGR